MKFWILCLYFSSFIKSLISTNSFFFSLLKLSQNIDNELTQTKLLIVDLDTVGISPSRKFLMTHSSYSHNILHFYLMYFYVITDSIP